MLPSCRWIFSPLRHLDRFPITLVVPNSTARHFVGGGKYRFLRRVASSARKKEEHGLPDIPSPTFQWAKVLCSRDVADALSEALLCFGASSVSMDELSGCRDNTEVCITSIFTEVKDVPKCISVAADSISLNKLPTYRITAGVEYDWTKNALENFYPIEVAKGLWIVPQWRKPPDNQATNIILNPGMAFGTGEHPTTKLCLLLLHGLLKGGESFLDYGTGSGILGIAAVKMGASRSVGVDVDPQAISSAEQNIALNGIHSDKMQLYLICDGKTPSSSHVNTCDITDAPLLSKQNLSAKKGGFDIVIANILLNPLIELADDIVSYGKPGAIIGLSGIIIEQVPQIKDHYSQHLDGISISEMDGWACLSGKKKGSQEQQPQR